LYRPQGQLGAITGATTRPSGDGSQGVLVLNERDGPEIPGARESLGRVGDHRRAVVADLSPDRA